MTSISYLGSIGPNLAAGIVTAQAAAREVLKGRQSGGDGGGPRYKYASTEDVVTVAKEALEKGKLAVIQVGVVRTNADKICTTYRNGSTSQGDEIRVEYLLVHESGETVTIVTHTPVIPGPGRPWDKAVAAAETYSMGYALRGILLLVRTDESEEPDARDDRDVAAPGPKQHSSPGASPPRKQDGPAPVPPVSTRAASSGPSNGGAPLPSGVARIKDAIDAAFSGASEPKLKADTEAISAFAKKLSADDHLGVAAVKEIASKFGTPKERTDEQWFGFKRALEERWAQALNNADVRVWQDISAELGEKVSDEVASKVWAHEGQPPEDWDAEQLHRAIQIGLKVRKDVPG